MDFLETARQTILIEREALNALYHSLDERFTRSMDRIKSCQGRIVVTGVGKSALVGQKMVATLNSTGTHALFMHAADAVHGDLGMIAEKDLVICISKSGETNELKILLPILKNSGRIVLAMTSNEDSYIAQQAHEILYTPVDQEADPNNLAPTSSSTVQIAMGDAIAMALLREKGFEAKDFARFHPGGSLGKKLYLKVSDLDPQNHRPAVQADAKMRDVLIEMSESRVGATAVLNGNEFQGIITDGDIRRWYENQGSGDASASEIMNATALTIDQNEMAAQAYDAMRNKKVNQLIVMNEGEYVGVIHIHELLREGFV